MCPILGKCLLFLSIIFVGANEEACPSKCTCRRANQSTYLKVKCGDADNKVTNLEELDLLNLASEIVHFNLSNNLLGTFYPKVQLIALQKLDLSRNQLTELQNNQFAELPNLRRLDISVNSIKSIELLAFANLSNLERLKLNQNQITSIALGTFDPVVRLKQLDISCNPLTCDCSLLWLLDWSQKKLIKLVANPTCSTPPTFKGYLLRKLKIGDDIHCNSPGLNGGLPIVEMKPDANQVVFEGDTLKLQCTAPSISDTYDSPMSPKIEWTWLDSDPKLYFPEINVESHFLQSTGFIVSTLRISKLKRNHTGIWNCLLLSMQGNHSKGIVVVVISDDTKYCSITVSKNNKGTYTWPRTIVNYTATIPCESVNLNYEVSSQKASYFCSENGQWKDLNTSMCAYTSETTKILEQFSKVNSSIMESAKHFRNYTSNRKHFKDVMDFVFAVQTMDNYLKYLTVDQIGSLLIDVSDNLLQLPKTYLRQANIHIQYCMKLVDIIERISGISTTSLLHKSNVATEIFPLKRNGFSGLKCTWYADVEKSSDRMFYCVTNTEMSDLPGKITEASITIPETLFQQLKDQGYQLTDPIYKVLISMYSTNKIFPVDQERLGKEDVTTAVVGAKLVNVTVTNLTDPVYVMLKRPSRDDAIFTPAWWNPRLQDATGSWSTEGCHFSHKYQDHVVFYCDRFGYYGLLEDVTDAETASTAAKFKLSHPAVYVGSFILFVSLLVVIVTYLLAYASIQMPKKAKHCLINLWISICFLCFLYVFGIYQTEDVQICQIVGMLLHYFTLSSLLWMCVGVNCMHRRLSKSDVMELQDDELPSDQPVKKSILGLYFVGWGVASIVCGISAAINIKEYASSSYCFLRMGPPLSALYIPTAMLLMFLGIFFLLIRCAIYNLDANGHLSEGTQATENVDLDLLEPNFPNSDIRSVASASSKTASSEVEDTEHAPSAQLKAYVIFLCIYVLTWSSCAFATSEPYGFVSFEDDLFSIAYAILATVLSAFTVFFYCVARSDVRGRWIVLSRWVGRKRRPCFRSRNVSDAARNVPHLHIQQMTVPVGGDPHVTSRSSSRSSSRTKSSNILKAAADLNVPTYGEGHTKINNVNLIMLHRQQYRTTVIPNIIENPTNAAEVFYNPHQSIVARKFFKRQKRHMMKRNNLVARPRDSDATSVVSELRRAKDNSSVDRSIFGTKSKVNNTNIHVERVHKKHQQNPNIFSDSADECATNNVILNAERLRRREAAKHKLRKKCNAKTHEDNMRSVSQQCTLEYSSENVSDSILDKASPDKGDEELHKPDYVGEEVRALYVTPHEVHLRKVQSRGSSVSVSDLDELYQQIRRGSKNGRFFANSFSPTRNSPCFSDSDIHSCVTDGYRQRTCVSNSNVSDNVETTV